MPSTSPLSNQSKEKDSGAATSSLSFLQQLCCDISLNTAVLSAHIRSNNLPQPGFDIDAPLDIDSLLRDPLALKARNELANLGKKLYLLMLGPAKAQRDFFMNEIHLISALDTLCQYRIPQTIPENGEISFEELSSKTELNLDLLTRFIRLAECNYIFKEPRPGFVAHTARSLILARDESAAAHLSFSLHEAMPAMASLVETLKSDPIGATPPFNAAFGMSFFEHKKKTPDAAARFAKVMKGTKGASRDYEVAEGFDWSKISGLLVDVGGGIGNIAASIARRNPDLNLLVEDMPTLEAKANEFIASQNLSARISFQPHDFFTPQPSVAKEAAVYLLSHVLHDWPGAKCREILHHIVDAMKGHSKIMLCESVLPEPGAVPEVQEALVRAQDLGMLCFLGAKERSVKEFEELMRSVNEKLQLENVEQPREGGRNWILVFGFAG